MPEYLYLTSPLRDIDVRFKTEPAIDVGRNEPYFPSDEPAVKGYYPQSNSVVLQDGTTYRFHPESGLVTSVEGGGKPSLTFEHKSYRDGSLTAPERGDPNLVARPPPLASKPVRQVLPFDESRGDVEPTSGADRPVRFDPRVLKSAGLEIHNRDNGKSLELRRQGPRLIFVAEQPRPAPQKTKVGAP
jgi:hypothetical protein